MAQPRRGAHPLHGLLAVALLVGVYLLVLLVVAATVGLGWLVVTRGPTAGGVQALVVLAVSVVLLLRAVVRSLRLRASTPAGFALTPDRQPRLWDAVRRLADAVGTPPPDEIHLVPEVNAAVYEDSRWLGLRPGVRRLYIGAPLVLGMPTGELLAVLGHELGHLGGRHSATAGVAIRGYATLSRIVDSVDNALVGGLFRGYLRLYDAATSALRRANEREADRAAVAATGRDVMAGALRRLSALDVAWDAVLTEYAPLAELGGRTPDLFAAYAAVLAQRERWPAFEQAQRADLERPTARGDSHPPRGERLALIARCPDTAVRADLRPAAVLFADLPGTLRRLQEEHPYGEFGPESSWPEAVSRAAWAAAGRLPGRLAHELGPERPPLTPARVLDALADGSAGALVAPAINPDLPPERRAEAYRDVLTDLLVGCLTRAVLDARRASVRVRWAGDPPYEVVGVDGRPVDWSATVAPAVAAAIPDHGPGDRRQVVLLRERLRGMGLPLDRPVEPVEPPAHGVTLLGVLTGVRLDRVHGDLLVLDAGLLFVKQPVLTLRLSRREHDRRRVADMVGGGLPDLLARPGSRMIDADDVVAATLRGRLRPRLTLQLADGATVTLAANSRTSDLGQAKVLEIGEGWEAIGQVLGDRLQPA